MDVTRLEFAGKLPMILEHIADAHFLSFDLELSGIPDQKRNRGFGPKSLTARYTELKCAAEKYHVLQVGLSCVQENPTDAKYLIRSYNFNISPLVDDQLDLERDFTYSSGAVDFLLRHGYQVESAFAAGIPYLTRTEAKSAMEIALARWDTQSIPDIKIKSDDTKALNFVKRVKNEIETWQATRLPRTDHYDITGQSATGTGACGAVVSLNRFERRLVHQVVRADYPSLQTLSRNDGVQVKPVDLAEQQRSQASLRRRIKNTIFDQTGFRWVAEAMAGNDPSDFDPEDLSYFQSNTESSSSKPTSTEAIASRTHALYASLKGRKKVLVGHNCLLDLVYFFRTFYGPLPDTVEQFQRQIHDIFPLIIDTKYLSTNPGSSDAIRFRNSQLSQIEQALDEAKSPILVDAEDHLSYQNSERYHEAGFDSYITAKVFLKLACKIALEHPHTWKRASPTQTLSHSVQSRDSTEQPTLRKSDKPLRTAINVAINRFFHPNSYSSLVGLQDEYRGGVCFPKEVTSTPKSGTDHTGETPPNDLTSSTQALHLQTSDSYANVPSLIPSWDSPFWHKFGNKIRVYGTIEEVCDLTDEPAHAKATSEAKTLKVTEQM